MRHTKNPLRSVIQNHDPVVVDLVMGILLLGAAAVLVGFLFVPEKKMFILGVLLGTASSVARALHMAYTLERQLECGEKEARAYAAKNYTLRYVFIILVMIVSVKLGTYGIVGTLIGIFLMKPAALMQPFVHRHIYNKLVTEQEITGP